MHGMQRLWQRWSGLLPSMKSGRVEEWKSGRVEEWKRRAGRLTPCMLLLLCSFSFVTFRHQVAVVDGTFYQLEHVGHNTEGGCRSRHQREWSIAIEKHFQ